MKNLLSRISKKSVALLVAVALVLTSVATIVVASADTPERYTVTAKDPVIPMTAGYSVNLADFDIEGEDSTALTLDGSVDAADIEIVDGVIKAYERGVYKATAGDMTVYIVVKAPNETEYVLYENDYREYTADEVSDWNTVFTKYSGKVLGSMAGTDNRVSANLYDVEAEMAINPWLYGNDAEKAASRLSYFAMTNGFLPYNPDTLFWYDTTVANGGEVKVDSSNLVSLRINHPEVGYGSVYNDAQYGCFQYGHGLYAITVLDNEAISAFQNYKVTATMRMRTGNNGSVGIAGRISTDGKGFAVKDTFPLTTMTTIGFNKGNETGFTLYNKIAADEKGLMSATVDSGTNNFTRYELDGGLAKTLYFANSGQVNMDLEHIYTERIYEYDFNGTALTVSSPDIPDTETDSASITFNAKEGAGNIGFFTRISRQDIISDSGKTGGIVGVPCVLDIKVTLNDSVNPALLPTEKINDVTAADKVFGEISYGADTLGWEVSDLQYAWIFNNITVDETKAHTRHFHILNKYQWSGSLRNTQAVAGNLTREKGAVTLKHDLGEVTLPTFAESLGDSAFWGTNFLEKVNNLDAYTNIGESAFNSSGIVKVAFSDRLDLIKIGAFRSCVSLKEVDLGNGVTKILNNAFYNTPLLTEITLPASLQTIGSNVFTCDSAWDFYGLQKVYIYNPNLSFGTSVFPTTTTIYGKAGSTAQTYAEANGNPFVAIDDAIVDKAVADYNKQQEQFTLVKVPANSVIDLADLTYKADGNPAHTSYGLPGVIVEGDENVTFADASGEGYSIVNGILTTGAASDATISITGSYSGKYYKSTISVPVTIQIVAEEDTNLLDGQYELLPPEPSIEVNADPENENTYIATVDPANKTLIPNSVVALDNGKEVKALATVGTTGKSFAFQALTSDAVVTVKYLEDADMAAKYGTSIEDDIFFLGREIRVAGSKTAGIKFKNRLPAITYNSENDTISTNTILLDNGEEVTVNAIGTLVIPSVLLRDAELKITDGYDADDEEVVLGELNGQSALNIKHQTVTAYTEDFSDVKAILGGLDQLGLTQEQYKALQISAVTYIEYLDANDNKCYIYGDVQESSYNDVWNAMYPMYDSMAPYFEYISSPANIAAGDTYTVSYRVAGNLKVNFYLLEMEVGVEGATWKNVAGYPQLLEGSVRTVTLTETKPGYAYRCYLYAIDPNTNRPINGLGSPLVTNTVYVN